MWGTSSPGDKLTGDFGNEPDATSISDRGLFPLLAENLSPGVFRLLQHNLPGADISLLFADCFHLRCYAGLPTRRTLGYLLCEGQVLHQSSDDELKHCISERWVLETQLLSLASS